MKHRARRSTTHAAGALLALFMGSASASAQDAGNFFQSIFGGGIQQKKTQTIGIKRKQADLNVLRAKLAEKNLELGQAVHIRAYKQERELEVWIQKNDGTYALYKTYTIRAMSGGLGPKKKVGDLQAVEGFYSVTSLNPGSAYTLSFDTGYPNAYDRARGYNGSAVMIHGADNTDGVNKSAGCYAIGDDIVELFALVEQGRKRGKTTSVHSFPFRMTAWNMTAHAGHASYRFWKELKPFHDAFLTSGRVPNIGVCGKHYVDLDGKTADAATCVTLNGGRVREPVLVAEAPVRADIITAAVPAAIPAAKKEAPSTRRIAAVPAVPVPAKPRITILKTVPVSFTSENDLLCHSVRASMTGMSVAAFEACRKNPDNIFTNGLEVRVFEPGKKGDSLAGFTPVTAGGRPSLFALNMD